VAGEAATQVRGPLSGRGFPEQVGRDGTPVYWVGAERLRETLRQLKERKPAPFSMLYDLTAIDERRRRHRVGEPASPFTAVYHLMAHENADEVRIKVPLDGDYPTLPTITDLWPCADWYEREAWDMFGIRYDGHPNLRRILTPPWWEGHPLRKEHPARATEMGPFEMSDEQAAQWEKMTEFHPEDFGMPRGEDEFDYLYLNFGPQHPGTHGPFRIVLQLDGEEVVKAICDIGYHHRGQEKMGERQSWHTYIPYTDRVDYLGGVLNNYPYVLSVEKLAGIVVPDRAKVIRIMLTELFRVISHLVYYGTLSQDVGAMSPVFHVFTDRERAFDIIEAITGGRMHPGWFRIGGVAQDLPEGWREMIGGFLDYLPGRMREYDKTILGSRIFKARTQGVAGFTAQEGMDWGATGPMLRATGVAWDLRKMRNYGGYEWLDFDVVTAKNGDIFDRAVVHVDEIHQSLRIIRQCLDNMPAGPYKADHPLTTPPAKERTLKDIETLIDHFLGVSWGPVMPPGEACVPTEAAKGNQSFYLVSDGGTGAYRNRVRTPSFPHVQMIPLLSQGLLMADFAALLGSIDYVMADVDR
jgi:NADH-quinone oxidoreductase subunit C/D